MARGGKHHCVGATLGAFVWLVLLSSCCDGYAGPSSWQVLAPDAVPAEPKMAKAFVVHLPIHTTQLESVEEQRQPLPPPPQPPAAVTAPAGFQAYGQNQVGREQLQTSEAEELKKLVILVRIPQEQPASFQPPPPPPPPPPPEMKRRPEPEKAAYDVQVDQKLPIILIALDKPLASQAKVQSVSAWKEPLSRRPASSKEDRSSGNSKESWRPVIYPRRQHSTPPPQRHWSRWGKNVDRRVLWSKEQQSTWKPLNTAADDMPAAAPVEKNNEGGSNEAKLLLLLVHENTAVGGQRWEPAQQNTDAPTSPPWRQNSKYQQQQLTATMQKSWRPAAPSASWSPPQPRRWQQQQSVPFRPRPAVWHSGVPSSMSRGPFNGYVQKRSYEQYDVHRN